jgi:hypothetical protein
MDEEQIEYSRIILESDQDYREAVVALDEQLKAASQLADNIAIMAKAIEEYEIENELEVFT